MGLNHCWAPLWVLKGSETCIKMKKSLQAYHEDSSPITVRNGGFCPSLAPELDPRDHPRSALSLSNPRRRFSVSAAAYDPSPRQSGSNARDSQLQLLAE